MEPGTLGTPLKLITNNFYVQVPQGRIFQYSVDISPQTESFLLRKSLVNARRASLNQACGTFLFTGQMILTPREIKDVDLAYEVTYREVTYQVKIAPVRSQSFDIQANPLEARTLFNTVFGQKLLKSLGFQMVNRNYFDPTRAKPVPQHKVEVWPGFNTSITNTGRGYLLNIDVISKIFRQTTVLDVLQELSNRPHFREMADDELLGKVVLTRYNNRTYRVAGIKWDMNPQSMFTLKSGDQISFSEYFKQHYSITLRDSRQPLISVTARKGEKKEILLPPELCCMTGLTDAMRTDPRVMKDVSEFTRVNVNDRMKRIMDFVTKLNSTPAAQKDLDAWGMKVLPQFVEVQARVLPAEVVRFQKPNEVKIDPARADFGQALKTIPVLDPRPLQRWVVIVPSRDSALADDLISTLQRVGKGFGIDVAPPKRIGLRGHHESDFEDALQRDVPDGAELVVCILPGSGKANGYRRVKELCCLTRPVPSQCVLAKTLQKKQMLMSVCSKIILQMNCKLGGALYFCPPPPLLSQQPSMVIGIDVNHTDNRTKASVASMCATMNAQYNNYFSLVSYQASGQELVDNLHAMIKQAVLRFQAMNRVLPSNIIVYRDGVGEGQLGAVLQVELPKLEAVCGSIQAGYTPNVCVVVVQKRVSARFAQQRGQLVNPPPGLVVDTGVVGCDFPNFYLVAQHVNQGTTTPTHYVIIKNTSPLRADDIQSLTFKLCFMYFNWPGAVRVPAPVMYAHKLAFLVGQFLLPSARALRDSGKAPALPAMQLSDKLYFL